MWILILLVVGFVASVLTVFVVRPVNYEFAVFGMLTCGLFLLITLATIPIYRADTRDHLAQREALQQTYNKLRAHPLEMATVGKEIAEWNAWLASAKYWNGTQWRWWWPDDVKQTKPIR